MNVMYGSKEMKNAFGLHLFTVIQQPFSRGTLKLKTKNPLDHPLMDPRYLEDEKDVEIILEGNNLLLKDGGQGNCFKTTNKIVNTGIHLPFFSNSNTHYK